jgi:hypothetical protein
MIPHAEARMARETFLGILRKRILRQDRLGTTIAQSVDL